ncbi:uncharacterized protein LOC126776790 isoform X3 [Nymphalis io]|uniref:uncharacterized protein LOC126776790 isoform X3 n=1 Tax=Inachis io TaxID=171585 RepID=UPI002168E346|nr:uncharacterized protein LOC126776790 isoform X3 [Nymphalis io]
MSFGIKPDQANASETSDDSGVVFDNQKSMKSPVATETTQSPETTVNQTLETNTTTFGANNNETLKANNNETCGNILWSKTAAKTTAATAGTTAETSVTSSSVFGTVTTTPAAIAPATANNQTLQAANNIQTFGSTNNQKFGATNNPAFGAAFGYIYVPNTANSLGIANQIYGIQSHSYGIPYRHLGLSSQNFGANNTNAAVRGASGTTSAPDTTNTQTVGTGKDQNSVTTNNNTVSGSGFASMTASNTTNSRTFGTATNQSFGVANNQNFGTTNDNNAFGVAFRAMSANATNTQQMGAASAGTAGTAGIFSSMSAQNAANAQAYEAAYNQVFGAQNNQSFGTNTANNQTFAGASSAMPNNAGAQFGSSTTRNYWNQSGLNNTQPFQRPFAPNNFGNNANNDEETTAQKGNQVKLGTTNINIDEPIVITGYNDNLGISNSWLYPSLSRGMFDNPFNCNPNGPAKLSSTNITIHQPITITEQKAFGVQSNSQPTQTVFGVPVTTTSSNGSLSTTNITVRKPINLSGSSNTFKFGINPTQATTFGSFNAPITTNALEKLCTTNININKPISINGNSHPPGRNPLCAHNCHICRLY